jgi:ubiquinone/menaquinone biosynthesis C-methylase UbiE
MDTTPRLTPAQAYEAYYGPAIFQPLTQVVLGHLAPRHGERVLDVACGTGIVARAVAARVGADGMVVGVDVNPGMLDVARVEAERAGAAITWHEADGMALPLPDASFDAVVCQQGLQFFPDRAAGVTQMRRVLVDGGRAVVATWFGIDEHPLYRALADAELPHLSASGLPATWEDLTAPFSLGDRTELADLLRDAGFRSVEIQTTTVAARFPDADRFVERMEYAYAAVVPRFAEDAAAFSAYLDAVDTATRAIVAAHRRDDHVVVPMHANIVIART